MVSFFIRVLAVLVVFSTSALAANLNVLTLNAWILKDPIFGYPISRDIDIRLALLPYQIEKSKADIVFLQEVWPSNEKEQLIKALKSVGFGYVVESQPATSTLKGILGNGLIIASKYELDPNISLMSFSNYTRIEEFFAAKGAMKSRVKLPDLGWVDVYNTHLGAVTTLEGRYQKEELEILGQQSQELRGFIENTRTQKYVIVAGDFNSHYFTYDNYQYQKDFSVPYSSMTCLGLETPQNCLGFIDSFRALNGFRPDDSTYDTENNFYAQTGHFSKEPASVLDYVFVSPELAQYLSKSEVVFNQQLTFDNFGEEPTRLFMTDHFGVMTSLKAKIPRKKTTQMAVR